MWGRCASPLLCNQSQITQTNEPNIHLYGADLLIDPPGGVFAPVNGLGDLLLLGPPRIFSRYPVQCSRGDCGGGCIWSVTSHECLMGLGAGEFGGQVGALSSAVVGGSSGKADVTAACRIQWVTRMIVWCRLWCAGGGRRGRTHGAHWYDQRSWSFPLVLAVKTHLAWEEQLLHRTEKPVGEIREFVVMVSPSQTLASPQATSLCISDYVFHDVYSTRSVDARFRWKSPPLAFSALATPISKRWPIRQQLSVAASENICSDDVTTTDELDE